MMFYKTIAMSLGLLTLVNCNAQKDTSTETNSSDNSIISTIAENEYIELTEGQSIFLKDAKITLTFKGILEDSRCPEGMQCVWAGTIVAQIDASRGKMAPTNLKLATIHMNEKYMKTRHFNGYNITLEDCSGSLKKNIPFKVKLSIKKGADNTTSSLPASL